MIPLLALILIRDLLIQPNHSCHYHFPLFTLTCNNHE